MTHFLDNNQDERTVNRTKDSTSTHGISQSMSIFGGALADMQIHQSSQSGFIVSDTSWSSSSRQRDVPS